LKKFITTSGNNIRILNYHPTISNTYVPQILKNNNVLGALGHSSSTSLVAEKHINLGINHLTHFYNACSEFNHRTPGIVFLGLKNKEIYLELICDQYHLDKEIIKFTYKVKTAKKIILITDSTFMKGLKNGNYLFAGQEIIKKEDKLTTIKDQKLAGSCLSFNKAFLNFIKITKCKLKEAQYVTSINISSQLKLNGVGFIGIGMDANLVILSKKYHLLATFVKGKIFFDEKKLFS
jgi:N-acetylglucosamine-6-phosphate deacetylase